MERLQVHLLPKPNQIIATQGFTFFPSNIKVSVTNIDVSNKLLRQFGAELEEDLRIKTDWVGASEGKSQAKEETKAELRRFQKEESYTLEISSTSVILEANALHGLFNGFQTLRQLLLANPFHKLERHGGILLPCLKIHDWPALRIRGVADDVSRGQIPTVDSAKRFIRDISRFKNNCYALYMEDVFACSKHPKIGKDRGAFTALELKEIDEYAKSRFVALVPIFETLTHWDNILTIPEYRDLGEFPGAQCAALSESRVYSVLHDFIREMSPCFSSKMFHIGNDESFDLGHGKSKKLIENLGLETVLLRAYRKVYGIAKKCGSQTVIMYHDAAIRHPMLMKNLPKDLVFMFWDYKPKKKYSQLEEIIDAGFRVIVSPAMQVCCRHFPDYITGTENAIDLIEVAKKLSYKRDEAVLGQLNSTWGNQYYSNFRKNYIYGAIFSGTISWTIKSVTMEHLVNEMAYTLFGLRDKSSVLQFSQLFYKLSRLLNYYAGKARTNQQEFFTYLYRHPFRIPNPKPIIKRYKELLRDSQDVLNLIDSLYPHIRTNRDYVPYLQFSAKLSHLLAEKDQMTVSVNQKLRRFVHKKDTVIPGTVKRECKREITKFLGHAQTMFHEYERLWTSCAKRPNLETSIARFRQMIKFCKNKITQIDRNVAWEPAFLPSAYIWSPDKYSKPRTRYFRKAFIIEGEVTEAKIQAIVGNYGKIYVNGHYVGEVLSRWSQSILVLRDNVRVFDVTRYLVEGQNVIGVEANNFLESVGFANIYLQYKSEKKGQTSSGELVSDGTWIFREAHDANALPYSDSRWTKQDFPIDDAKWKQVRLLGFPPTINYDLYKTDLLKGEKSYAEEFFGYLSYLYYEVYFTNGKRIAGMSRRMASFILKHIIGLK
jgi:hypothetical protein